MITICSEVEWDLAENITVQTLLEMRANHKDIYGPYASVALLRAVDIILEHMGVDDEDIASGH